MCRQPPTMMNNQLVKTFRRRKKAIARGILLRKFCRLLIRKHRQLTRKDRSENELVL
ncbi:unnamed protein product [Gongylonema pulchrum]|uniref:Uncharacterized protein n=1 Tax=Gongylonema pulchrum TaxID=637853 RepID=A0A183DBX3_9BILA|nr:unnamed protein product [Gongylonema pulchrum]